MLRFPECTPLAMGAIMCLLPGNDFPTDVHAFLRLGTITPIREDMTSRIQAPAAGEDDDLISPTRSLARASRTEGKHQPRKRFASTLCLSWLITQRLGHDEYEHRTQPRSVALLLESGVQFFWFGFTTRSDFGNEWQSLVTNAINDYCALQH